MSTNSIRVRALRLAKIAVGWCYMMVAFVVLFTILLVLLPSRIARIKAYNHFGTITGSFYVWLSGCSLTVTGREHLDPAKPAIFASNHSSALDIFIAIRWSPTGTVGVAKKQVGSDPPRVPSSGRDRGASRYSSAQPAWWTGTPCPSEIVT